jgi:hypothetical protein
MAILTVSKFFNRLITDITDTKPMLFGKRMRANVTAAFAFETEHVNSHQEKENLWSTYIEGPENNLKTASSSNPAPGRGLSFWNWPYFLIHSARTSLFNVIDRIADDGSPSTKMSKPSPNWAVGIKALIASIFYIPETLGYFASKIADAVLGKVKDTSTTLGLIGMGLALAGLVAACILFPPALPIVLLAAKCLVAVSAASAGISILYTAGVGVAKAVKALYTGIKALYTGIKKLFDTSKKAEEQSQPHNAVSPVCSPKQAPIAGIERASSPISILDESRKVSVAAHSPSSSSQFWVGSIAHSPSPRSTSSSLSSEDEPQNSPSNSLKGFAFFTRPNKLPDVSGRPANTQKTPPAPKKSF